MSPYDRFPLGLSNEHVAYLENLVKRWAMTPCDLLLVADGSGSRYNTPAAWACVAYDRRKWQAVVHAGTVTGATNNYAELFPFVHALWQHHQDHDQKPMTPVHVHIVSDSEVTVCCGNGAYSRNANGSLWASVKWFEEAGYRLFWTHVRRNSNPINAWMDAVAGRIRAVLVRGLPAAPAALT